MTNTLRRLVPDRRPGALLLAMLVGAVGPPARAYGEFSPNVLVGPPPGTTASTVSFSNSTPVVIAESGNPTVTSTIVISGAGTWIWDLDLTFAVTHAVPSDLQIALTSPAGTVVTVSSNPLTAAGLAIIGSIYDPTQFDDQANPGGLLPYESNPGLVAEHPYVGGTTASPLAPVEALSAFRGENPNGTWTLTLADRLSGAGGTLASWNVLVSTIAPVPTTSTSTLVNGTPVIIPATAPPNVVTSSIAVSGTDGVIIDTNVVTSLLHTRANDIDMTLTSPAGTVVTLTTDNGGVSNNVFNGTTWDDDADPDGAVPYTTTPEAFGFNPNLAQDHPYQDSLVATPLAPEEALGAFSGEVANGTWTLTISDDANLNGGTLANWSLVLVTGQGVPGFHFADGFEQ